MPTVPHTVLEIRTGKDSLHTPESAIQLLSSLPKIKRNIFYTLLGQNETISLEILVQNQYIYFLMYVPNRLVDYITGLIQSAYKDSIINPLTFDPALMFLIDSDQFVTKTGLLKLKKNPSLPLKTYQSYADTDPLGALLSTLSKSRPQDNILIQIVLGGYLSGGEKPINITEELANQIKIETSLSSKKNKQRKIKTEIRLVVGSDSSERSQILLETLGTAFGALTEGEGNELILRKTYIRQKVLLKKIVNRKWSILGPQYLSLEEVATIFHLPSEKLAHIPNIAWGKRLKGEPPANLPLVEKKQFKDEKRDINPFAKTEYKNIQEVYGIKRADRRRHMYVIGKTGTGKSTLLANMAINDLKSGEGLCVIDPHGDLVETLLDYIPRSRINDVIYFDPADSEKTVKINLFEGQNVQHRELIASGIVSVFQKLYAYSWGPRLEYILRNSLLTLLKSEQAKLSDILDLLTDENYREKVVANLDDPILRDFWLNEFEKMPQKQKSESIAPILNKVGQFVSSPLIRNVVNANKSSFSIEDVMNQGKILLVNLSQGKLGEDNATLLGAMMITKIQLAAMGRVYQTEETRKDFYLYVDEFQNFATESFTKILSEARKYRLNLTLANQYIAQIPEPVQKAIFGNCGTIISFVMGAEDASLFQKEFSNLYTLEDLMSLNRYQIVNKLTIDNVISAPFTGYTLNLAKSSNQNKDKVIKVSRERWARKR